MGFEPTNGGFADLSLGPLGYRAKLSSISKPFSFSFSPHGALLGNPILSVVTQERKFTKLSSYLINTPLGVGASECV